MRSPRPAGRGCGSITDHGAFTLELEAQRAPLTCANFLNYVDARKYDGASFFRRTDTPGAPQDGTVVAAPSPKIRPFPPIAHESTAQDRASATSTATISLGRFQPGTATDNVFICLGAQPAYDADPHARGDNLGYAAFGHVSEGIGGGAAHPRPARPRPQPLRQPEGRVADAPGGDLQHAPRGLKLE